ncbi:MAG: T9SS type A sorting domain-containing protein [Bacteroidetes bacterium]|nr:T9SS type A sorting domain-containing protein [Bacteroidota bacterium]
MHKIALTLYLVFSSVLLIAQSGNYNRLMTTAGSASVASIVKDDSTNYYLCGDINYQAGLFMKTDSLSNIIWSKKYDIGSMFSTEIKFRHLLALADSSYLLCGSVFNPSTNREDGLVVKVNQYGDTIWSRRTEIPNSSLIFNSVSISKEHGFYLYGNVITIAIPSQHFALKMDSIGNAIWSNIYSTNFQTNTARCIYATPDSGAILVGTSINSLGNLGGASLIKLEKTGQVEWSNYYSNGTFETGEDLALLSDGYLCLFNSLFGTTLAKIDQSGFITKDTSIDHFSNNQTGGEKTSRLILLADSSVVLLTGTDMEGNISMLDPSWNLIWSRYVRMRCYDVLESNEKELHIIGGGPLFGVSQPIPDIHYLDQEIGIVHTDSLGTTVNCLFNKNAFMFSDSISTSALSTTVVPSGQTNSVVVLSSMIGGLSTNNCVTVYGGIGEHNSIHTLKVSPNPTSGSFVIENIFSEKVSVALYTILFDKIVSTESSEENIKIDLSNYPAGIYLAQLISSNGKSGFSKVIKE